MPRLTDTLSMSDSLAVATVSSAFQLRMRNLLSAWGVIAIGATVYRYVPYNQRQMNALFGPFPLSFTGAEFLLAAAVTYAGLLSVYFLLERKPMPGKSLRCFLVLLAFAGTPRTLMRQGLSHDDRVAVLTTLLKAFFGPLMVMSLMSACMGALSNGMGIAAEGIGAYSFRELFDRHGFWFLMKLILFVDVLIFTFGYLVEMPALGNRIRSVDPTLLGWGAAMVCYPPFNKLTSAILGSPLTDFPQFDNPTTHLVLNFMMLGLMAIYASASVALGFKASNLTHRGVVARGPYSVIRHPAYVCKNMAWWIGSVPLVSAEFAHSTFAGIQAVASVVGWSLIYVLRAMTEEDHLRGVDGEYAAYAARVSYRFIPGLI
jgi:hypothetical protein